MGKLKIILKKKLKEEKIFLIIKLLLKIYIVIYFTEIFEDKMIREIFPSYF
jgi:hypothetical protein